MKNKLNLTTKHLGTAAAVLVLATILARMFLSDYLWLTITLLVFLVIDIAAFILKTWSRTTAYGLNSFISSALVIAIVGLLNYFGSVFVYKHDMTKGGLHTLSDQTVKVVKGLNQDVQAVLFGKYQQKEENRPLLEN